MNKLGRNCAKALPVALALIGFVLGGGSRQVSAQENQAGDRGKIEVLHVQGNVYMIAGAGANITVQVGPQFVIVVDSGLAQRSAEVLAAIRNLTDKHILFVIDTSADADHTGGNGKLSQAGWALPNSSLNPLDSGSKGGLNLPPGASIIAHINVLNRMSEPADKEKLVDSSLLALGHLRNRRLEVLQRRGSVYLSSRARPQRRATVTSSSASSDVISVGDILTLASYPVIRADEGGSINGEIKTLNQIIDMLEPEENEEGGTYVIPGHGRICDRNDVVNYRDMVTIIRGRMQALIKKGMTLDQVKAAKPTLDYDGLYGATSGFLDNRHVRHGGVSGAEQGQRAVGPENKRGQIAIRRAPVPVSPSQQHLQADPLIISPSWPSKSLPDHPLCYYAAVHAGRGYRVFLKG
jgi:cyclase